MRSDEIHLFPHHPNIHKHIQISFIVRLGILHQWFMIGYANSHDLYWDRNIFKYPSS